MTPMKNIFYNKTFKNSLIVRNHFVRFLILVNASLLSSYVSGQSAKQLVQADQYFESGEYVTAAGLYGQYLNPGSKSKKASGFPLNAKKSGGLTDKYQSETDVLFKQAESYRMANMFPRAAELYLQCFEKDHAKYNSALYWNAICERSMAHYKIAENNLDRFIKEFSSGNSLKESALEEKQRLQFIKVQLTRPDSILYHVQKIKSPSGKETGVYALAAITKEQIIFTGTQKDSVSAGENPNHNRLFTSILKESSLQDVQPVLSGMNQGSIHQGASCISADGKFLYFTQWTKSDGQITSLIMVSAKTGSGWSEPKSLVKINRQGSNNKQPSCSPDGKYLFFSSDRKGGYGNYDIWYAPLLTDGTTGDAINVGAMINTAANEQAPFYHSYSHSLVFSSDRLPGMGGYDLFVSKGTPTEWKKPENMGAPVNSSRDDLYFFASGNENLLDEAFISSDRGSECCLETYMVSKKPKNKILTGLVRDCGNNEVIPDATVIIKNAEGKTMQSKTSSDGAFQFEWTAGDMKEVLLSREKYNDKTTPFQVAGSNETDPFTDTMYHAAVCMDKKLVLKIENVVTVYFNYNESRLKPVVQAKLDSIYQVLVNESNITIQISGYSDDIGSAEYNKKLSEKRAKACSDYLINKGIDPARISYESFGACCPVEMKLINVRDRRESKSLDRRALININRD